MPNSPPDAQPATLMFLGPLAAAYLMSDDRRAAFRRVYEGEEGSR